MSFGYQVLGFGSSASVGGIDGEVIQSGAIEPNVSLSDTKAGDIIFLTSGSQGPNSANTNISGFTSLSSATSSEPWQSGFSVKSRLSIRILDGTETAINSTITNGGGAFAQWRFPKAVQSVSYANITGPTQSSISGTAAATTHDGPVIRWLSQGCYTNNPIGSLSGTILNKTNTGTQSVNGSMLIGQQPRIAGTAAATNFAMSVATFSGHTYFRTVLITL